MVWGILNKAFEWLGEFLNASINLKWIVLYFIVCKIIKNFGDTIRNCVSNLYKVKYKDATLLFNTPLGGIDNKLTVGDKNREDLLKSFQSPITKQKEFAIRNDLNNACPDDKDTQISALIHHLANEQITSICWWLELTISYEEKKLLILLNGCEFSSKPYAYHREEEEIIRQLSLKNLISIYANSCSISDWGIEYLVFCTRVGLMQDFPRREK